MAHLFIKISVCIFSKGTFQEEIRAERIMHFGEHRQNKCTYIPISACSGCSWFWKAWPIYASRFMQLLHASTSVVVDVLAEVIGVESGSEE